MTKDKVIHARVDDVTHDKLVEKCNMIGCTVTDLLKSSLTATLNDNNSVDLRSESTDTPSDIPPTQLNEKRPSHTNTSEPKFEPHYDRYGNYFTYDKNKQMWTCKLIPNSINTIP